MSICTFQTGEKHFSIIIGLGLIGQQIYQALKADSFHIEKFSSLATNWHQADSINQTLDSFIKSHQPNTLDIIWSAGKAGFASTDEDMSKEFDTYAHIVQHLKKTKLNINFNLLSSAGGIYENSGHVKSIDDISTTPNQKHPSTGHPGMCLTRRTGRVSRQHFNA